MKLSSANLAEHLPDGTRLETLTFLSLRDKEIAHIEDLSRTLPAVKRIDFTNNAIRHADALSGIRKCRGLTQLVLQGNQLTDLDWVEWLPADLHVLNVSRNEITVLPDHITACRGIRALMLNHNKLKRVDQVANMPELNTLVVSHNKLEEIAILHTLPELVKLSAAHNKLRTMPDVRALTKLHELRLTGNRITTVEGPLPTGLRVLDLGENQIGSWQALEGLKPLTRLQNLTLKGNPLAKSDDYEATITRWFPKLRVLDGRRIDAKFLDQKQEKLRLAEEKKKKEEEEKEKAKEDVERAESEEEEEKEGDDEGDASNGATDSDASESSQVERQHANSKRPQRSHQQQQQRAGKRRQIEPEDSDVEMTEDRPHKQPRTRAPSALVVAARRKALLLNKKPQSDATNKRQPTAPRTGKDSTSSARKKSSKRSHIRTVDFSEL